MCTPPQVPLSPQGSGVCRPPPQSLRAARPAPESFAARQLWPQRRAPLRATAWLLHRWRGVRWRVWRTHQEAAGERSPRWRKARRERRVRASLHEATRTLMTAMMIQFSSHQRGSEDRDRGMIDKPVFLPLSCAGYCVLDANIYCWVFCDALTVLTTNIDLIPEDLQ